MKLSKQQQLDQIAAEIIHNNVCPDLAKTATNLVMGEGNPDADIVFIGEAPGKNEDEQGRPFVGASGKFLNELLASIGLERQSVFITSVLKYRPPGNRDPEAAEKAAFLPYLRKQLRVIQPKLVITLGRHSTEIFLPEKKISQVHGRAKRLTSGLVLLPLFHPAAALYNGGMRQTLIDDFKKIPKVLELIRKET